MILKCVFLNILLLIKLISAEEKCIIVFSKKESAFRPLVYNANETELLEIYEGAYHIANGNNIIFTCKQHEIADEAIHSFTAQCKNGQLFDLNNELVEPSELKCTMRVLELNSVILPQCNGDLAQYQFNDVGSAEKSTVAETCYDTFLHTPIYSHYKVAMPPQYIENKDEVRPASYMSAVDILTVYRSDELNLRVTKILGKGHIKDNNTLHTVSLIPKELVHSQFGDVSRRAHNLITLWDNVIKGNFKHLVQDIKKLQKHQRVLEIFSGPSKVPLQATSTNGKLTDLYLQNKKNIKSFPVPQFYWIVVHEEETDKAIALIIKNDVQHSNMNDFCNNICDEISWIENLKHHNNYKNYLLGETICCDVKEFIRTVNYIPILNETLGKSNVQVLKE